MRIAVRLVLTDEERLRLERWARGRRTAVRLAERARIVLLAADGLGDKEIAAREACDRRTAARWRKRFATHGLAGIESDAPRPGAGRRISHEKLAHVVDTMRGGPPPGGKRWSTRALARAVGLSEASIRRIWRAQGIAPHLGLGGDANNR